MSMHARRTRRWTGLVLSMGLLAVAPLAWAVAAQPAAAQAQGVNGYELPSAALQAVVDAPRAPALYLSPRRDVAALMQMPSLPSIQVVAQPELKLAGLRINPRTFSDSRFSFGEKLWLMNVADGKERQISGLPGTLSIASLMWSPDQKWLAFNQVDAASGANELWLVDVVGGSARRLVAGLNTVIGSGYQWLPDSRGLVVFTRPANLGAAPAADGIPTVKSEALKDYTGEATRVTRFDSADAKTFGKFESDVADLSNFLGWMAEPGQLVRKQIGVVVLLFLFLFLFVAIRMNAAYWKHVR